MKTKPVTEAIRRGRPANPNKPPAPPKRPTAGRPPIDGHKPLPTQIEGIKLASALLKVPAAFITQAKQMGCPAFMRSNRINTAVLIPWLFDMILNSDDVRENMRPQDQLALTRNDREKVRLEIDRKRVMPIADAEQEAAQAMSFCFEELERRDRELPPSLEGCDAARIGKLLYDDTEKIRVGLKAKFEKIGKGSYKLQKA